MYRDLIRKLVLLGFSEKAAATYVALLELRKASVTEIANKTGIQRTSVYDVIAELEGIGMVRRSIDSKSKKYLPESPGKLPIVLEARAKKLRQQAKDAESLAGELSQLEVKAPSKPKVAVVEGKEGLRKLYDASLTAKSHIRSFLTPSTLESFDSAFIKSYFDRRVEKGIRIQGIVNDSPLSREYKKTQKKMKREMRLVPDGEMNIVPEVYIYDNTIAIFSHSEQLGLSIESKDIADAFKALYDLAWKRIEEN